MPREEDPATYDTIAPPVANDVVFVPQVDPDRPPLQYRESGADWQAQVNTVLPHPAVIAETSPTQASAVWGRILVSMAVGLVICLGWIALQRWAARVNQSTRPSRRRLSSHSHQPGPVGLTFVSDERRHP